MSEPNAELNKAILRFGYDEYHAGRRRALLSKAMADPVIKGFGEDAVYEHLSDLESVGFLLLHDLSLNRSLDGSLYRTTGARPALTITSAGIDFLNRISDRA